MANGADMWGDLLEVNDPAAEKNKSDAELKRFTVDEVRTPSQTAV
jgi:hypothetical protein